MKYVGKPEHTHTRMYAYIGDRLFDLIGLAVEIKAAHAILIAP